jgi:hypothetical protein
LLAVAEQPAVTLVASPLPSIAITSACAFSNETGGSSAAIVGTFGRCDFCEGTVRVGLDTQRSKPLARLSGLGATAGGRLACRRLRLATGFSASSKSTVASHGSCKSRSRWACVNAVRSAAMW